jgi:hypothetical protein
MQDSQGNPGNNPMKAPEPRHQLAVIINASMEYDAYCSTQELRRLTKLVKTINPDRQTRANLITIIADAEHLIDHYCSDDEMKRTIEMVRSFHKTGTCAHQHSAFTYELLPC